MSSNGEIRTAVTRSDLMHVKPLERAASLQGITGGVTSFSSFESKFFPEVLGKEGSGEGVTYCQYDNQALQLFTSSLYLAGIFSTLVGGYTSRWASTNIS